MPAPNFLTTDMPQPPAISISAIIHETASAVTKITSPKKKHKSNKLRKRKRSFSKSIHTTVQPAATFIDQQLVTLRKFLRKSSARDKLLATLQYACQLYIANWIPEDAPQSYEMVAMAFEKNISDARKGFRLFKWIDEYGKIRKIVTAPSNTVSAYYWKIVPVVMRICAFGYYLIDNTLWVRQITQQHRYGRRDKRADQYIKTLKTYKNNLSLWRTLIALAWGARLIGILGYHRPKKKKNRNKRKKGRNKNEGGTEEGEAEYLNSPIQTTQPWIDCIWFHSVLQCRGIMNCFILCKHLGLYSISNVWVGRLGVLSNMLGMWKHWGVKLDYFVEFKK